MFLGVCSARRSLNPEAPCLPSQGVSKQTLFIKVVCAKSTILNGDSALVDIMCSRTKRQSLWSFGRPCLQMTVTSTRLSKTAQSNIASTADHHNLIFPDGKKSIRFAENVFVKRPIKIEPPDVYMGDYEKHGSKNLPFLFHILIGVHRTRGWQVDCRFPNGTLACSRPFSTVSRSNQVRILGSPFTPLWQGRFVEPTEVEEQSTGALVELCFDYFIQTKRTVDRSLG
ncbi:hypothetical protein EDB92DRAFT_98658 [Lactarius akahatsu]|uniref:Uncharacterized protein n=1 Tax=Lactarius akahatsu TaxID=416441 RepID=A0AAD4LSA6_9AGAM|nr:hypothetical protein EDB92DRAFT_98658 [Lactarius akahatsu]